MLYMENGAPYVRHILVMPPKAAIAEKYRAAMDWIRSAHVKPFPGHPEPLFLISNTYPGVWLEHVYDAVCWARLEPSMAYVARSQVRLFLENQKEDGQLPHPAQLRPDSGVHLFHPA